MQYIILLYNIILTSRIIVLSIDPVVKYVVELSYWISLLLQCRIILYSFRKIILYRVQNLNVCVSLSRHNFSFLLHFQDIDLETLNNNHFRRLAIDLSIFFYTFLHEIIFEYVFTPRYTFTKGYNDYRAYFYLIQAVVLGGIQISLCLLYTLHIVCIYI